jgi:phospholipid-translocating ATPase
VCTLFFIFFYFFLFYLSSSIGGSHSFADHLQRTYTELASLAFTSDRKRMSVLVRDESDGTVWLFMKGADDVVAARVAEGGDEHPSNTPHLESLARLGLRTLSVAARKVSDEESDAWIREWKAASVLTSGRDAALEQGTFFFFFF